MKSIHVTKKIIIALLFVLLVNIVVSNYSQAIGEAFTGADEFLGKRRKRIKCYRWIPIKRNIKFYVSIINGSRDCSNVCSWNNYRNTIYGCKCRR